MSYKHAQFAVAQVPYRGPPINTTEGVDRQLTPMKVWKSQDVVQSRGWGLAQTLGSYSREYGSINCNAIWPI
jgi:hypothetical protein